MSFTIGRYLESVQIKINGKIMQINTDQITSWESSPKVDQKMHLPISGNVDHANFYQGWQGSFEATRVDDIFDNFQAGIEADYYNGLIEAGGTIVEGIKNSDGTIKQYIYTKVLLKVDSFGPYTGDSFVSVKFSFVASRRQPLN